MSSLKDNKHLRPFTLTKKTIHIIVITQTKSLADFAGLFLSTEKTKYLTL